MGVPSPTGKPWWPHRIIKHQLILNDLYRPHAHDEIAPLVTPEVAESLGPGRAYGIWWWNRRAVKKLDPGLGRNGGGRYRATTTTQKDREEWVAVPVPASERLSRELVDRAREAVMSRAGNERKHRTREWELKNLVRCRCGQLMILNTSRYKGRGLYYYRCRRSSGYGPESCPQTLIRAERIEAPVWEFVYSMLTDPSRLRLGLERVGEEARGELSLDPEREIRRLKEDISEAAPAPRVPGPAGGGADDAGQAAGVHRRGREDARGGRG